MNTTENNKLIAKFIKLPSQVMNEEVWIVGENGKTNFYKKDELKFHSSWDWLMQVVEKIESLEYVIIHNFFVSKFEVVIKAEVNRKFKDIHITERTKIEAVYNACLEFINWYNENSAKQN